MATSTIAGLLACPHVDLVEQPPPSTTKPEPEAVVTYDLARATLDIRDAETNKPIAGAVVTVGGGKPVKTGADGTTAVDLPWGAAPRVLVEHPSYIPGRDVLSQVGYTRRIVWLTPRRADNAASLLVDGQDQKVRFGPVAITVPAGALPAGTRVDFAWVQDRSLVRPEGALFPGRRAPIALHQLQVDVHGTDPHRFQRIVDPQRPLQVALRPPKETLGALAVGGKRLLLSAGASLEVLPDADVTLDMSAGELRFPLRHFSDVTVATDAPVEGGCAGQPVVLHFWRMTTKSSERSEGPFPAVRACQGSASIMRIDASVDVSTTYSGSWSTGVRDTERLELALLGGGKGKLFGQGLKVLAGYWRQQNTESTTSAGGEITIVSSSTINVSREKTCPGGWACRGELWIDTMEDELEIIHYSADLTSLLGNEPEYSQVVRVPTTSCITGRTTWTHLSQPDQERIRRYGEGLATTAQLWEAEGPGSGAADPFIRRTIEAHRQAFQEEVFQTKTLRYAGSRMATQSVPPRCDGSSGGTVVRDRDGGSGSGSPGNDGTPPQPPVTRPCPNHPRSPLSPMPGASDPDGMIDRPGPVGSPTSFSAGGAVVIIELIAGPTATLPPQMEEVAWANACCPAESNQVRFSTQVQINVAGTGSNGHGNLTWNGATWKAEAELGFDLPLIGAQAVVGHDGRFAAGTGQQVQSVLRQIASVRRAASATVSAAGNLQFCETQGLFAYYRRTEYTMRVTVRRGGQAQVQEIPLSASFYSTPFAGPKRTFEGHCAADFSHLSDEGTTVPPGTPDGGVSPDAGAANLGCAPGPGCEACCEMRATSGAAFSACRATCQ